MVLFKIPVDAIWLESCDKGLRMLTLNFVLWVLAIAFLGSNAPFKDMLVLALFSVAGYFVYYMIIRRYLVEFVVHNDTASTQ